MNLFLDTNILIDITADRKPFSQWAIKIFKDGKKGKWKLFSSSISILTTYYIIEKQIGATQARRVLKVLLNRIEIQDITKRALLTGLTSNFKDYEDAIQHECAKLCHEIDYIITRNKRDYKNSIIKVLSSEELYFDQNCDI